MLVLHNSTAISTGGKHLPHEVKISKFSLPLFLVVDRIPKFQHASLLNDIAYYVSTVRLWNDSMTSDHFLKLQNMFTISSNAKYDGLCAEKRLAIKDCRNYILAISCAASEMPISFRKSFSACGLHDVTKTFHISFAYKMLYSACHNFFGQWFESTFGYTSRTK